MTVIGRAADVTGATYTNTTVLGHGASGTASNQVRIGNNSVTSIGGYAGWTNLSDARFKSNIQNYTAGLDFILKLRPVTYNLNFEGQQGIIYTGFLAQEVEFSMKELGINFSGLDAPKNETDYYGLRYADFVVPLVNAVQELSAENDSLKQIISSSQDRNAQQQETMEQLQNRMDQLEQVLARIKTGDVIASNEK